jgi:parvulin-like peptidyl-prolyl isomerase
MNLRLYLSVCCLLSVLTSLPLSLHAAEPTVVDGLAARVNDTLITVGDVLMQVYPQQRKWPASLTADEVKKKLEDTYHEQLDSLIEQKLILGAYEKQENKIPDTFVQERVQSIIEENFAGDRSQLMDALAKDHITFPDWKKGIREQIIIASMRQTFVRQKLHISPEAVRAYYDARTNEYASPVLLDLNALVYKGTNAADTNAQALAGEALVKLRAGASFASLSKTEDKGNWGWMQPSALQPEFASVVTSLKVGEMTDVLKRENDFYIFSVQGRKESHPVPFEDVRDSIEAKMNKAESSSIEAAWMARLKHTAAIEIFVPDMPK